MSLSALGLGVPGPYGYPQGTVPSAVQPTYPGYGPSVPGALGATQPGTGMPTRAAGIGVPPGSAALQPGAPGFQAGLTGRVPGAAAPYYYQPPRPITAIRVFLETEAGGLAADDFPVNYGATDDAGWLRTEIPLSAFAGSATARSSRLVRVVVSAESSGTFYVARADLIGKAAPVDFEMSVAPSQAGSVAANTPLLFRVVPTGGVPLADMRAFWDFNDQDGVGIDASGVQAVSAFAGAGKYRITCTVVDVRGDHLATTKALDITVRQGTGPVS